MSDTPTPRTDAESYETDTAYEVVSSDFARTLERELTAVTEQLKAAQDGWHDEITKGLSELRRAESLYTKAQERAERVEEQRDRLAGGLKWIAGWNHQLFDENTAMQMRDKAEQALRSLNPDHNVAANDMIAAVKGGSHDFLSTTNHNSGKCWHPST